MSYLKKKRMEIIKEYKGVKIKGELDTNHFYHILAANPLEDGLPPELRGMGYGKDLLFAMVKKYGYALSGNNYEHIRTPSARNMWNSIMRMSGDKRLPDGFFAFRCVDYHGVRDALAYLDQNNKKHHIAMGKAIKSYVRDIDEDYIKRIGDISPLFKMGTHQAKLGAIKHAMLSEENAFGIGYYPKMEVKDLSVVCNDKNPDYQLNLSYHELDTFLVESVDPNIRLIPPRKVGELTLFYNNRGTRLPDWVYNMEMDSLDLSEFVSIDIDTDRLKTKFLKILENLENFETIKSQSSFKVLKG